ncbi:hypothetical protein [Avibacterium avium]|uniref:hypothetical protein n=1 Tax=Avibacterium avium TaxID=751 RepID=UPI003BF7F7E0
MNNRTIPLVNCPNGNKIFRKITPSESEANIRLIFRKENFIVMRKSNLVGVPFSLLPFFWERKRKEVAQRAKYVINPKKNAIIPMAKQRRMEVKEI